MKSQINKGSIIFRGGTIGEKLLNPNVNQFRLNNEQRLFYTQLFNENASSNGNVKRENFLPLLGIFGTKIAQDFSDRMFLVLSKGRPEITLEQYLNYIDTYHYGDVHERCLYTCKLMDMKQKGKIELEDFQSYINLIINTVKKVNNTITKKDLMSDKDIEYLFYHISKGKTFFTYNDFENIYQEKPELVSWFDYFKNDKEDILLLIHEFVPVILKIFNDFICNFMNDLFLLLDKEKEINLDLIFQKVLNYSNKIEKIMDQFRKKVSKFNITSAFNNLKKQNYNKRKLIYDLQNNIFESDFNHKETNEIKSENIDDFFNEIKKSLYQKDEKEFILDNKNENLNFNNERKFFAEKLVKRSTIFRNKNFKFFNEKLRDSDESINKKKNSLSLKKNNTYSKEDIFNRNPTFSTNNSVDDLEINLNKNEISKNNTINNLNINTLNNSFTNNINNNLNINTINNNNFPNNINDKLNTNNINNNNFPNNINDNLNINQYNLTNNYPNQNINMNINPYNNQYNTLYYNYNNYSMVPNYTNYSINYNHDENTFNTFGIPSYLNSNFESNIQPITNFYTLKESQKLKQLLFCSRVVIEKALEANVAFNNCYRWISQNYLSKPISKKLKEQRLKEKKKFKKKNTIINIPRKIVPVKKKIIGASEKSFEILFNMIMGIQIAVQAIPNFRITKKEEINKYLTKMLYSVQSVYLGKDNEESYLLKEFGGVIFNNIRLYLGINKEEFIKSISPQDFITELMISSQTIFEELCSTGSSGSLLYYTRDGEFIVKTISRKEYKFLKKMLGEYFFYLKENPISFLPKLLGCYVLKRKYKKKITNIYFIVMTNVFATDNHIDLRFDLKGSTIGRKVLTGTINDSKVFSTGDMALKDLDFNKLNEKVYLSSKREKILEQLRKDIEFLYSINSNDYSLLLGIHCVKDIEIINISKTTTTFKTTDYKREDLSLFTGYSLDSIFTGNIDTESNSENSAVDRINKLKTLYDFEDGGILSDNRKRIYYFGIIDILTEFNNLKELEYQYKRIRYCSEQMSCIPPEYYKQRFYNYLNYVFAEKLNVDSENQQQNSQNNTIDISYINNNINNNDNINNNKEYCNVGKFGAISSSKYKQYKKQKKGEKLEKYTMENSLQKFYNNKS